MYVKDVEDRSNTPKAVMLCMSKMLKMSKIDQIHLRAVMLCMSKMSKMGKEHTDTFWLITSLIINGFSIRKKVWKAETESFPTIPSNPMYVKACQRLSSTSSTCFNIHSISTYIALHPLGVFDLSSTPSTCHIPGTLFELQCRL